MPTNTPTARPKPTPEQRLAALDELCNMVELSEAVAEAGEWGPSGHYDKRHEASVDRDHAIKLALIASGKGTP